MSLRMPIPEEMRETLAEDPFMVRCIVDDEMCDGRVQWHHAFTYAGERKNELWAILPMCEGHHKKEAVFVPLQRIMMRDRIAHFHAAGEFKRKYPKSNLL